MNAQKVIYLLEILGSAAEGHEEELNRLYREALEADESVQRLKRDLRECAFYQGRGQALHEKGVSLLNRLYERPGEAVETLRDIRQAGELIEREAQLMGELLRSPESFLDSITVLPRKEIPDYLEVYKQIAGTCVYLTALYGGMSGLSGLSWNEAAGLLETVHLVNMRFLPALSRVKPPSRSWIIWKRPLGGKELFGDDGFFLTYDIHENTESRCASLRREAVGTHAFLNAEALEDSGLEVPYCWGKGNLLSVSPKDAITLLQTGAVIKPRIPSAEELRSPLPAPGECLNRLSDGKPYCISPKDLVSAMNQWQAGHEIERRKREYCCLFCGKPLHNGRLVCASHFSAEI